jgi:hypothetical protein
MLDGKLAEIRVPTLVIWGKQTHCYRSVRANVTPRDSRCPSASTNEAACRQLKNPQNSLLR